jgi:DNA-binding response OmpR family regulator
VVDLGEAGASGLSILVVESDPAARTVLVDHLRRQGFRIVESQHGGPAIRTAVVQSFDYMLADLDWIGISDGAALARWARTNRPETRIVLSSTTLSHWFPSDSAMAGLPILKKPFDPKDLERVLAPVAVTAIPGS